MSGIRKAYSQLKTNLGRSDAINEYVEVLLRNYLEMDIDEKTLQHMSEQTGIRVNSFDTPSMEQTLRRGYLITVSQNFDVFLNCILSELNTVCELIHPLPEEGSTLFKMYRCLLGPESWKTDHGVLYYICDYYRSIRNETAHGNEKGTAAKAYERLLNNRDTINRYIGKLKFPSPPDKPGFDDFVLYSKSVKELAQEMCNCIQYDIDRIASRFDIERYKKRRNNLEKCRKSIAHEINMKYGLVGEKLERTVDLIIDKL